MLLSNILKIIKIMLVLRNFTFEKQAIEKIQISERYETNLSLRTLL